MSTFQRLDPGGPAWPHELDVIDAPPACLWARGRLELLARTPRVALVGSRAPTPYGERIATRLAEELAREGVAIVSGLARGIDSAAHRAALDAGGCTLAVLGSGVDRPWPDDELAARMVREGLLLSEYVPGLAPRRHHFPWRNRLIAGLAQAVVVIEAAHASGSLITARWAADQGRTVLAVPGRVDQPMARGCHRLLKEGAGLCESSADVLLALGFAASAVPEEREQDEDPVLAALRGETQTAEELAQHLERPLSEVLVRLIELELAGSVVRAPGGLYRRT